MIEVDIISKVISKDTGKGVSMFGGGESIDLSAYATLEYVLGNFVTLDTEQTILGKKNFTGGLLVNGSPIYYDAENKYWKLEGDLLVTGGVTMYADEGTYTPSTIMDALLLDPDTLEIDSEGRLTVIGGTSSGGTVSGDYLPLTGGKLTGSLLTQAVAPSTDNTYSFGYSNYRWAAGHFANLYVSGNSVLHLGNYSSYALPLSGGTLTGTLNSQFVRPSVDAAYQCGTSTLRWDNVYSVYGTFSNSVTINGNSVWHSGNDGAGSGLEADYIGVYGNNSDDKVIISGSRTDNTWPRRLVDNGYGLVVERTTNNGLVRNYIATLSDNVASATKLQTARTIWGQSFDGSGNVDGRLLAKVAQETPNWISDTGQIRANASGTNYNIGVGVTTLGLAVIQGGNSGVGAIPLLLNPSGGNVGVGTTSPTRKFQVDGIISCKSSSYTNEYYINPHTNGFDIVSTGNYAPHYMTNYAIYKGSPGSGSLVLYADANLNVGIGTTSPAFKLDINGDILTNGLRVRRGSDNAESFYFGQVAGSTNLEIRNHSGNGRVSIKTNYNGSVTEKFAIQELTTYVVGDLLVTGGITMYSDIRKKTILNHVELSLKQIADAPLIEHFYNSDEQKTTHVGSIAQYWAGINDWFCKKDAEGFYTMEIQNAALASAISIARHLERYESKTDKKIRKMQQRIIELEDELEKLKRA